MSTETTAAYLRGVKDERKRCLEICNLVRDLERVHRLQSIEESPGQYMCVGAIHAAEEIARRVEDKQEEKPSHTLAAKPFWNGGRP